ncbi:unnamed protein product, partial [Tilletia laevis]
SDLPTSVKTALMPGPAKRKASSSLPANPAPSPAKKGTTGKKGRKGNTSAVNDDSSALASAAALDKSPAAIDNTGEGSVESGSGVEHAGVVVGSAEENVVAASESSAAAGSVSTLSVPITPAKSKNKTEVTPQWKNDAFGPGHPSSYTILLNWLQEDNNYDKWKGSEGNTQEELAQDIVQRMKKFKIKQIRKPGAVVDKIKAMEKSFRDANDWRKQTGQGVLDDAADLGGDGDENEEEEGQLRLALALSSVEDTVRKMCPFYYELAEVMGDRIAANPKGSYS